MKHTALYVNNASKSCLIVNDLRPSPKPGAIALWIGPGTEAYLKIIKNKD